jgi:ribonuclease Z
MTPLFHPKLVNGPLGDPSVYVDFKFENRAILFDLGDIRALTPRAILKVSHIFISHTHMDHFIGFDHFLRICLGRPKVVSLFGPPNFLEQVKHKLSAYTWNLIETYSESLDLQVHEIHPGFIRKGMLRSSRCFEADTLSDSIFIDGMIHQEEGFSVRAAFLDHKIPCLAFALKERFHVNILKTELEALGLPRGPWLKRLKEALWREEEGSFLFSLPGLSGGGYPEKVPLGYLRQRLIRITPGQKIGYVADTLYNEVTRERIVALVRGADLLFMETPFLDEDGSRAREKCHLTAGQAGSMAAEAGVQRLIPFHVSPKYSDHPDRVIEEALSVFRETSLKKKL